MKRLDRKKQKNAGMTLIELLVTLTIFAAMSSIVVFNYDVFQAKVDINNLSSEIALHFVKAQKSSISGKLPPAAQQVLIDDSSTWKPSYGVHIDIADDNKSFIYFTDTDQNRLLSNPTCNSGGECLEKITIKRGNVISKLEVFYLGNPTPTSLNDVTVTYARPNSGATINSTTSFTDTVEYIKVTILSPKLSTAAITIFLNGRVNII